jgi:hypothetical protein
VPKQNFETLPHVPVGHAQQQAPDDPVSLLNSPQTSGHIAMGWSHQASELQQALGFLPVFLSDGMLCVAAQLGETEVRIGEIPGFRVEAFRWIGTQLA